MYYEYYHMSDGYCRDIDFEAKMRWKKVALTVQNRSSMEPNCEISIHYGELSNTVPYGVRCSNTVDDLRIPHGRECGDFGCNS